MSFTLRIEIILIIPKNIFPFKLYLYYNRVIKERQVEILKSKLNMYMHLIVSLLCIYIFTVVSSFFDSSMIQIYIMIFFDPILLAVNGFICYYKFRQHTLILSLLTLLSLMPLVLFNTDSNSLYYFLYLILFLLIGLGISKIYIKIKS